MMTKSITKKKMGKEKEVVVSGCVYDITEHKQVEEALRQSEEKYRTILEDIEDGYFEVDLGGNFTFLTTPYAAAWDISEVK